MLQLVSIEGVVKAMNVRGRRQVMLEEHNGESFNSRQPYKGYSSTTSNILCTEIEFDVYSTTNRIYA
jgi:hypothetical protein